VRLDRATFSATNPTRIATAQASHRCDRLKGHLVSPGLTIRWGVLQLPFQRVIIFETGFNLFINLN